MKKCFICALILIVAVCLASPNAYADNMFKKLGRGILNLVTCPAEIFLQPARANVVEHASAAGLFASLFRGVGFTVGRALAGVYDVATFPIPVPFGYKPVFQPETVFDGLSWIIQKDWPFPRFGFGRVANPMR